MSQLLTRRPMEWAGILLAGSVKTNNSCACTPLPAKASSRAPIAFLMLIQKRKLERHVINAARGMPFLSTAGGHHTGLKTGHFRVLAITLVVFGGQEILVYHRKCFVALEGLP